MQKILGKLPKRFQYTLHNVVGHPLSELVFQFTANEDGLSGWIHEVTLPKKEEK